ncbi:MAG TPA: UPF0149 family protein [Gammaproteobacteria bacterium]|nr:UPF0149 family protein [Gammaproteobacteria bacterium]
MPEFTDPLSQAELDQLDEFLLERIPEGAATADDDEGLIGVSELDGFFTAVVSAPEVLVPSQWLPAVWGEFEPTWQAPEDFEAVLSLFVRHMNDIAVCLTEAPDEFEPIYLVSNDGTLVVDEWCEGYMRGVTLSRDDWDETPEIGELMYPMLAFTHHTGWLAHDIADPKERDSVRDAIAPNVRHLHAYWFRLRSAEVAPVAPFRRDQPRIGRNDPCTCGSGKKYKNCCAQ